MRVDLPGRRARSGRDRRSSGAADRPADDRAHRSERGAFRQREELDLPAARAEPGQAASGVADVTSQRAGGEDREREQQRATLATEQEEAAGCDLRCRRRGRKGLGRRRHLERVRARVDLRRQPLHLARKRADRPRVHSRLPRSARTTRRSDRTSRAPSSAKARSRRSRARSATAAGCGSGRRARPPRCAARAGRMTRTACPASGSRARPRSGGAPSSTGSAPCLAAVAPRSGRYADGAAGGPRGVARSGRDRSRPAGSRGGPGSRPRGRASRPRAALRSPPGGAVRRTGSGRASCPTNAPLHVTWTMRSSGARRAVAWASARSCITSLPASTAASTAAPAITPTAIRASRSPPPRSRAATRRRGNPRRRREDDTGSQRLLVFRLCGKP